MYEVDLSKYPTLRHNKKIAGVSIPEIYPEKTCIYLVDNGTGELVFIDNDAKEKLQKLLRGHICTFENVITNEKSAAIFKKYKEYIVVDAFDFNLILNNGPLWEFMLYYREIPFTTTSDMDEQIDIDQISEYNPQDAAEEMFKSIVTEFGPIDTVERAFELEKRLNSESCNSVYAKGVYSSKLIDILRQSEENEGVI